MAITGDARCALCGPETIKIEVTDKELNGDIDLLHRCLYKSEH